ncbi:MAG: arginase [Thermoanaerobaculum sp.]|nr:MAG: arginase [Thermoanaerobaculum sp.]
MAKVLVMGVPMDLGQSRRGTDMGPSAMRYARLAETLQAIGHEVEDVGNLQVPVVESLHGGDRRERGGMVYVEAIREVCRRTAEAIRKLDPSVFPILLGGDHSVALGSIAGLASFGPTGVVWVDAHADFNTPETSPSGNVHGMPLAALCGLGDQRLASLLGQGQPVLNPQNVVLVGVRSVDPGERETLKQAGVTVYTMKEVDRLGIARIAEDIMAKLAHLPRVHVSLDADVLDPEEAPGVGTPVPGGLSYREAHLLMELLADWGKVTSLDLVEVNPILDRRNRTAQLMVELAASLLGKRIL